MSTCEVCGTPDSEWPMCNKGERFCSENCKRGYTKKESINGQEGPSRNGQRNIREG